MNLADRYIKDVTGQKIVTCKFVTLAVQRHVTDIKRVKQKAYPYYFDIEAGERAIKIAQLHRHTKGIKANQPFDLQPYQAFILFTLFGWKRKENDHRRFRKAYIETARKSGKSEFAAVIALIGLIFDGEFGSEIYTVATKRDQARIVFDRAHYMARALRKDSKKMASMLRVLQHNVNVPGTNSKLESLASDSKSLDGLLPHFAIVDEYHAHRDDSLVKVLETGMSGRSQPILFVITTAGFNVDGPCYQFRGVVVDILEGRIDHDSVFGIIYTLDEDDDWKDEKSWIKANPHIGITPTWDGMRAGLQAAINEGAVAEIEFKTKNLNVWTSTSISWISDEDWQACGEPFDPEELKGRTGFVGLDLAAVKDLTALAIYFPAMVGLPSRCLFLFWLPEATLGHQASLARVNYHQWVKDGYIKVTPGNAQDYDYVRHDIMMFLKNYDVKLAAFDPWNKVSIIPKLVEEGLDMFEHRQGYKSMNQPCKVLEKMVLNREINHGGNPVMRWMISNVALSVDPAGSVKIDKAKSQEKVDGVVALVMAISAAEHFFAETSGESIYESSDIKTI